MKKKRKIQDWLKEKKKEDITEIFNRFGNTSQSVKELMDRLGLEVEIRFGRVVNLLHERLPGLSHSDDLVRNSLIQSYESARENGEHPTIHEWLVEAIKN